MKDIVKNAKTKDKVKTQKNRMVPKNLLSIHFDDAEGWMNAYRTHNEQLVARSVINAFRKRYFLSQKSAALKLGISNRTLNNWENGIAKIRWKSRNDLVCSGWFKPQHFGLDVPASEFTDVEG